jgi:polygalacturonase
MRWCNPLVLLLLITASLAAALSNERTCNVLNYGAVGDGKTDDSAAIQRALSACGGSSGGTVLLPAPHTFLSGPFNLTSFQTLVVDGTLLAIADFARFPVVPALPTYCQGREIPGPRYGPFVGAWNATDVTVGGFGVIDGQGRAWWDAHDAHTLKHTRPRLLEFLYVDGLRVLNVTLRNSPFWTIHPYWCSDVEVAHVTVDNPVYVGNTDGCDPDSSIGVHIHHCSITCGDDGVAIKSGMDWCGRTYGRPSSDVLVEHNVFYGTNGVAIGSEMSGSVHGVTVRRNRFVLSGHAAYIKSARGRGGVVSNVTFEDNKFEGVVSEAIYVTMDYSSRPPTNRSATPVFTDLRFVGENGTAAIAGSLDCLPESPCTDLTLLDVDIWSALGFSCADAHGSYKNVFPEPSCLRS